MFEVLSKWTVRRADGRGTRSRCEAKCECGDVAEYDYDNIRRGNTSRCRQCAIGSRARNRKKHGRSYSATSGSADKAYSAWSKLRGRCNNLNDPRYSDYGGRGISVCKRWDRFENFLADMGEPPTKAHSIDRINVDGDYCPENCKWASAKEQANNKRTNRRLTIGNETLNLCQWAERYKINAGTIARRLSRGWSAEKAITTPARQINSRS